MSVGQPSWGVGPHAREPSEPAVLALLSELSVALGSAGPPSVDDAIRHALERITSVLRSDSAFLYVFSPDRASLSVTHQHSQPGLADWFEPVRDLPYEAYPEAFRLVLDGQVIDLSDVDAAPAHLAEVASAMSAFRVRGLLVVPLVDAGTIIGGLGLSWVKEGARTAPALLSVVRTVGQLVAGALARTRAQAELSNIEHRIRSFIATTAEAISCYEATAPIDVARPVDEQFERVLDSVLVECNAVYSSMRKTDRSALLGRPLRDLSLESLEVLRRLYRTFAESGYVSEGLELTQTTPEGTKRHVVANVRGVVENGELRRIWTLMRDVTVQREAEERQRSLEAQLRQIQKLESIGLLAGGIAHDFNNLLLVTSSYAALARSAHLEGRAAELMEALARIEEASGRGAELTQQLLAFSRQQPIDKKPVDIEERVRSTLGLLARIVPASVALELRAGGVGLVSADPSQIDQIIVNLVVNAVDSIDDKGRILLETSEVTLEPRSDAPRGLEAEGRFALLEVTDDGRGMPPEVCERIFEPFFTTKGAAKGTGLGLSVVYGIAQQHGGQVRVRSTVGKGTTFSVYLPLGKRSSTRASRPPPSRGAVSGGTETILLAEDNALVRALVTKLLERAGYRVLSAKDGSEAKRIFDQHGADIALLVVDAVMPNESGNAVIEHVRRTQPRVPVIVSSGYSPGTLDDLTEQQATYFVPKPYEVEQLLRAVRIALDERSS